MPARAAAAVILALAGVSVAGAASADTGDFSFADARIAESSGLVALADGTFVTTNDSGDSGRVFVVSATGKTVRVAAWSDDAVDQEAVAPSGRVDRVWVGDTGDNGARRANIVLRLVGVGAANAGTVYRTLRAVYPDGAHDAETLMLAPDGRLMIVTKGFLGGTLFAVPKAAMSAGAAGGSAEATVTLEEISSPGAMLAMATDGAFFPDGRHFLVRGYVSATLYAWPSLERLGSMTLPGQRQGEGMAIAADGTLWLTSEGTRSTVLHREVSQKLAAHLTPKAAASADPGSSDESPGRQPDSGTSSPGPRASLWPWLSGGVIGLGLLGYLARAWGGARRRTR